MELTIEGVKNYYKKRYERNNIWELKNENETSLTFYKTQNSLTTVYRFREELTRHFQTNYGIPNAITGISIHRGKHLAFKGFEFIFQESGKLFKGSYLTEQNRVAFDCKWYEIDQHGSYEIRAENDRLIKIKQSVVAFLQEMPEYRLYATTGLFTINDFTMV